MSPAELQQFATGATIALGQCLKGTGVHAILLLSDADPDGDEEGMGVMTATFSTDDAKAIVRGIVESWDKEERGY